MDGDVGFAWKTAAGSRDISRYVALELQRGGYPKSSFQPDDKGTYYVQGYVERMEHRRSPGKAAWAVIAGTLQTFTLCLLPLYFEGPDTSAMVHVEVYDARGQIVKRVRTPVDWEQRSTCIWGVPRPPDYETVGRASGAVVASVLQSIAATPVSP